MSNALHQQSKQLGFSDFVCDAIVPSSGIQRLLRSTLIHRLAPSEEVVHPPLVVPEPCFIY
jgi:hypothetical protein